MSGTPNGEEVAGRSVATATPPAAAVKRARAPAAGAPGAEAECRKRRVKMHNIGNADGAKAGRKVNAGDDPQAQVVEQGGVVRERGGPARQSGQGLTTRGDASLQPYPTQGLEQRARMPELNAGRGKRGRRCAPGKLHVMLAKATQCRKRKAASLRLDERAREAVRSDASPAAATERTKSAAELRMEALRRRVADREATSKRGGGNA